MVNARYSLCNSNELATVGITDLKKSRGNLIDTSGCILLIVTSGYAVASINFQRYPLRRGCLTLFFYDEVFHMEKISTSFSARFVSLSYAHMEEAMLDVPSPHFGIVFMNTPSIVQPYRSGGY